MHRCVSVSLQGIWLHGCIDAWVYVQWALHRDPFFNSCFLVEPQETLIQKRPAFDSEGKATEHSWQVRHPVWISDEKRKEFVQIFKLGTDISQQGGCDALVRKTFYTCASQLSMATVSNARACITARHWLGTPWAGHVAAAGLQRGPLRA